MIKHLLVALMLSMVIIGCDSRYGGPIFQSHPSLTSVRQSHPMLKYWMIWKMQSGRLQAHQLNQRLSA